MEPINTDSLYYKQKVKFEIEIEPYKLFLATALLSEIINKGSTLQNSLSEVGRGQLKEVSQILLDKCGEAQEKLRKERGN